MRFVKGKPLEVSIERDLSIRLDGFSLHAAVSIPSHRRNRLEKLIRYMARPPMCSKRLSLNEEGIVEYQFKRPWKDGRTHVVFSPSEFMEKLSALVPLPYLNLTRYSGVLAPNSCYRSKIIPGKTKAQIKEERPENHEKPLRASDLCTELIKSLGDFLTQTIALLRSINLPIPNGMHEQGLEGEDGSRSLHERGFFV